MPFWPATWSFRSLLILRDEEAYELPALPLPESPLAPLHDADSGDQILNAEDRPLLPLKAPGVVGAAMAEAPMVALEDVPDAAIVPLAVAPAVESSASRSSSPSCASSASSADILELGLVPVDARVAHIRTEVRLGAHSRYILTCAHHPNCIRRRNFGVRQCQNFGEWEPIGYLMAWHALGQGVNREVHKHRDTHPTLAQIRAWLEDNDHL